MDIARRVYLRWVKAAPPKEEQGYVGNALERIGIPWDNIEVNDHGWVVVHFHKSEDTKKFMEFVKKEHWEAELERGNQVQVFLAKPYHG